MQREDSIRIFVQMEASKQDEIKKILVIPRIGERVIQRLKENGIETLYDLSKIDSKTHACLVGTQASTLRLIIKELRIKFNVE